MSCLLLFLFLELVLCTFDSCSLIIQLLLLGILVVLLSRGYNLNYRGDFASDFSNRYACEDLNSLQWGLNISNYSENRYPMELNSFWFLPPPVGRFLCTVSVAGVHLMYLCMSQFMSVLGVVSKSLHSDLCKLNSYFWRIAAGHHGALDNKCLFLITKHFL